MNCKVCGAPIKDGNLFCTECGAKVDFSVPDNIADQAPVNAVCPNCGAPLEDGSLFCTECGTKINAAHSDDAEEKFAQVDDIIEEISAIDDKVEEKAEEIVQTVEEKVEQIEEAAAETAATVEDAVEEKAEQVETAVENAVEESGFAGDLDATVTASYAASQSGAPNESKGMMICPECGAILPKTTKFCTSCGYRLDGSAEDEDDEDKGKENKKKEKKPLNAKLLASLGAAVVALAIVALCILTNNYTTPIKMAQRFDNRANINYERVIRKVNGNFAASKVKAVERVFHRSQDYKDQLKRLNNSHKTQFEHQQDICGKNYKVQYKITGKKKLTDKELRELRLDIQDHVNDLQYFVDEYDEATSEDWTDLADDLDLSRKDAKKLVSRVAKLCDSIGRVRVTKGYKINYTAITSGSDMKNPSENRGSVYVVKANGRWLIPDQFGFSFEDLT